MARVAARLLLLLRPIRASFYSSASASRPPQILFVKSWIEGLGPRRLTRAAAFDCEFLRRRLSDTRNFSRRGGKFGLGGAFVASLAAGIITSRPVFVYSFDDEETSVDIERVELVGTLNDEDSHKVFWNAGKLWLPVFFAFTVLLSLDQPIQLAVKVVLFLLSTKPSPLSVYLFIEQMRSRSMLQEPGIPRLQDMGIWCQTFALSANTNLILGGAIFKARVWGFGRLTGKYVSAMDRVHRMVVMRPMREGSRE